MSDAIATFRIELPKTDKPASAFELVMSQPWCILPGDLQTIARIAARENDQAEFEAIMEKAGRPLAYTRDVQVRGRTAVVPILGPIFRRANMFTRYSGATALETIATDIRTAVDNDQVEQIVMTFSSPGGQAESIAELADRIREMAKIKNIIAYADGHMTSAAYWLGAAANQVVVSKTAILGSIGTVLTLVRSSKDPNVIEIVSSQSPRKRLDPGTEEGQKAYQELADKITDVFIDSAAYLRGVDRDTVLSKFGQGGLFVGADAVKAGLADRIGSIEEIINSKSGGISMSGEKKTVEISAIDVGFLTANCPALLAQIRQDAKSEALKDLDAKVQEARASGATAERDRIKAVKAQTLPGHDALIEQMMFDGTTTGPQAAEKVIAADRAKGTSNRTTAASEAPAPHQRETVTEGDKNKDKVAGKTKAELEAMPLKERCEHEFKADAKLQEEFGKVEAYIAFKQAEANGQVRTRTPAAS